MAEPEGFEPSIRYNPYDDLANRCLQPLGHSSAQAHELTELQGQIN
jgi:hypothetical protein